MALDGFAIMGRNRFGPIRVQGGSTGIGKTTFARSTKCTATS
jgi:hypothetical protein